MNSRDDFTEYICAIAAINRWMLIREKGGVFKGTLMVVYCQLCVACLDFFSQPVWLLNLVSVASTCIISCGPDYLC